MPTRSKKPKKTATAGKAQPAAKRSVKSPKPVGKTVKNKPKAVLPKIKKSAFEPEAEAVPKKTRKKPVRPISSAVFRGKTEKYDFKVFSLNEKFEPVQAVYIISKRVTDRRKRGHHKLVCIGQTESIVSSIRSHKKDKCIKKNNANVVCLLKEDDENNRRRIEADLRAAHSIVCSKQG